MLTPSFVLYSLCHHERLPSLQVADQRPSRQQAPSCASRMKADLPMNHCCVASQLSSAQYQTQNSSPVVRLRLRELLVSQEPAMGVCRMDDIHVSPNERPRRLRKRDLRECSPGMHVIVPFIGTCPGRAGAKTEQAQGERNEQAYRPHLPLRLWLTGGWSRRTRSTSTITRCSYI